MRISPHVWMVGSGQIGLSNAIDCHVYLVGGPDAYWLVDAGVGLEPERILRHIEAAGVASGQVKGILITHAHADHACGAGPLSEALGAPVLASEAEAKQLAQGTAETLGLLQAKHSACYPPDFEYRHCRATVIPDGWREGVGECAVSAIVAPGHSVGATAYLLETPSGRDLFPGDTVFFGGMIGLLNCWGSSAEAYRESFHELASLGIDGLYPGHHLFAVAGGQRHLDKAAEALKGVFLPPTMG